MRRSRMLMAAAAWCLVVALGASLTWLVIGSLQAFPSGTAAPPATAGSVTSGPPGADVSPSRDASQAPARPVSTAAAEPTAQTTYGKTSAPSPRATHRPTEPRHPPRTPSPTASAPSGQANARSRTWSGSSGTVTTACRGEAIVLRAASPADGWRVRASEGGGSQVEVQFVSGGREVQVHSECSNGVPTFEVETSGGGSDRSGDRGLVAPGR